MSKHKQSKQAKYHIKRAVYTLASLRAEANDTTVREERAKLVRELAMAAGCTVNHIRKIWGYQLGSDAEVRMEHLVAFADVLGCTARDLLHEDLIKQLFAAKEYP